MTLPTASEITNLFLYGQPTTPENLLDSSLIRDRDAVSTFNVSINDYFMNGPGRFINVADFEILNIFFGLSNELILNLIPAGRYDELQITITNYGDSLLFP